MKLTGERVHPTTMLHHRHYSVEEANARLPLVGTVVRRMQEARRRLDDDEITSEFSTLAELTGGAWPGLEHATAYLAGRFL